MADDANEQPRRRRRVRHTGEAAEQPPQPPPVAWTPPTPRRISSPRPARTTGGRSAPPARERARPGSAQTAGAADLDTPAPVEEHVRWHDEAAHGETVSERGLRGLVGGGATQVNVTAAMRARDAARPLPADVARAETDLTVVRRYWAPRETAVPQEGSGGSS